MTQKVLGLSLFVVGCVLFCQAGATAVAPLQIQLDPALSQDLKANLQSDLARLTQWSLQTNPGGNFQLVFGATDNSGVVAYLNDRIHVLLPFEAHLENRIRFQGQPLSSDDSSPGDAPTDALAINVSLRLWAARLLAATPLGLQVGSNILPIDSIRIGAVQMGPQYRADDRDTPVRRATMLIHEARHSDCTGGLKESVIAQLPDSLNSTLCGHLHSPCPPGHLLAGLNVCDDHAWGANSIAGTYATALYLNCTNCDEQTRQQALVEASDAFDRVLPLEDLQKGHLPPDMSSTDVLWGQ